MGTENATDSIQNGIISALNKAEFLSIMPDGSTTKKSTEYEAIVVRCINTKNSQITNHLLVCAASKMPIHEVLDMLSQNAWIAQILKIGSKN